MINSRAFELNAVDIINIHLIMIRTQKNHLYLIYMNELEKI